MNKPIIMCVDDERQVLDSLRRDLYARYGATVIIELCESGEEALEVRDEFRLKGENIGVYIVDQRMPGMKGIDLLKQLEKETGKILLTAYADTEVAIEGINCKCIDFYVMKPYDENLFDKINYLLDAFSQGYFVVKARTEEERKEALELQNRVMAETFLKVPYQNAKSEYLSSPYNPITEMFVAIRNKEIVGTTSVNRVNLEYAEKLGTQFGLPIEDDYDLENLKSIGDRLVQVRAAFVKSEYQHMGIGPMIWKEMFKQFIQRAETPPDYAIILSGSSIAEEREALMTIEKLNRLGIYDVNFEVTLKNAVTYHSVLFDHHEIENLIIDPLVNLYAKIGLKCIGRPVYHHDAELYGFPMLLRIEEINEPFKSYFLKN